MAFSGNEERHQSKMEISLPMKNVGEGRMLLMEKKTKQNRTNLLILVNDCAILLLLVLSSLFLLVWEKSCFAVLVNVVSTLQDGGTQVSSWEASPNTRE